MTAKLTRQPQSMVGHRHEHIKSLHLPQKNNIKKRINVMLRQKQRQVHWHLNQMLLSSFGSNSTK